MKFCYKKKIFFCDVVKTLNTTFRERKPSFDFDQYN